MEAALRTIGATVSLRNYGLILRAAIVKVKGTRKLEESFGMIVSRDPYKSSFQLEGARSRQDHLDFRTWPWQIAWLF